MQGGYSIVDVLFGAYSPAGRTPVTWYQSSGQLPPPGTTDLYAGMAIVALPESYHSDSESICMFMVAVCR